jgi:hypothetical protein
MLQPTRSTNDGKRSLARTHRYIQDFKMTIPTELERLIEEISELVLTHPKHEMGQKQRLRVYEAL